MKKLIAVLLVLCILLTAACMPNESDTVAAEPSPEQAVQPSPEPREEPPAEPPLDENMQVLSDARYIFEQIWLPSMVFEFYSEEIATYMRNLDADGMKTTLVSAWGFVAMRVMMDTFRDSVEDPDWDFLELWEALQLGEHIVDVTIETLSEDTTAFIITMLDIEQFLRSTYIGIVYREAVGFQIFTLEQSHGFHMFCYVDINSRGSFFELENDREAFIEAIREVLETGAEAGAGIVWPN